MYQVHILVYTVYTVYDHYEDQLRPTNNLSLPAAILYTVYGIVYASTVYGTYSVY